MFLILLKIVKNSTPLIRIDDLYIYCTLNTKYMIETQNIHEYDINIESNIYDNDYDDVYTGEDEETIKEETDIQFE